MKKFTNCYQLQKTLRFELIPIGETRTNIEASGILEGDEKKANDYIEVKKLIDDYHKYFIKTCLDKAELIIDSEGKLNSLEEFQKYYLEKDSKKLETTQKALRKQISKFFKDDKRYNNLFKSELITQLLPEFIESKLDKKDECKDLLSEFNRFTTYFKGFHENRKNIYTEEDKSTAIAYRLIHENLPKFIDNIQIFNKIAASPIAESFDELYKNLEEYLNVCNIPEMFELKYFNDVLTQEQIDVYNLVIGGKTQDDNGKTKIKGLNEYINLFNQKQKDKSARLPKLKPLFKQILSDRNAISWLPEEFTDDNELLEAVQSAYSELNERILSSSEHSLKDLLQNPDSYNLSKIYISNGQHIREISQNLFNSWDAIDKALLESLKSKTARKRKQDENAFIESVKEELKKLKYFSIAQINESLMEYYGADAICIQEYFKRMGAITIDSSDNSTLFDQIEKNYSIASNLLNTSYPANKNLAQDKKDVEKIKNLLDSLKALQFFIKPLCSDISMPADKDERFYSEFDELYNELDNQITALYNKVRNYLTRKPYSTKKFKLNFENPTLMDGWDLNKEQANTTVILRKDGLYYLAVMNRNYRRVFDIEDIPTQGDCYEKMEYKLLPGANKMLPKVFFSKSRIKEFAPSNRLLENYDSGTHKKGDTFILEDCRDLIDFFKASIYKHEDWSKFDFHFSETNTYNDLSGFYREVEQQGYKITFRNISADYINQLVKDGKIYLFQIYNKDFSPYSKGTPNLHTLYWRMLFDERNLKDVVYKLNGEAEVFFRKKSINYERPTHPANQTIANKNKLNQKEESLFEYDLIKDKRYTVDKFQFHVPITINFKSKGVENLNQSVKEHIHDSDDLHIIGIDRGERHLLYLTVIGLKGQIIENGQFSLNEIINTYNGEEYHTDYHKLLSQREGQRDEARRSWQTIENIKDLKEGYLSQVVHKISELIVKYNAIVVLEDLNFGFKRSRQKVESSVYQKFEKMLIDKLNYLADKKKAPQEEGGIYNPQNETFDRFKSKRSFS